MAVTSRRNSHSGTRFGVGLGWVGLGWVGLGWGFGGCGVRPPEGCGGPSRRPRSTRPTVPPVANRCTSRAPGSCAATRPSPPAPGRTDRPGPALERPTPASGDLDNAGRPSITRSISSSRMTWSATDGRPRFQLVATGIPDSFRSRVDRSTMNAMSAKGTSFISSVLNPMLRSARSRPCSFMAFTAMIDSSNCTPAGLRSSEPRRMVSGRRSGRTARTASRASRWKRIRLSRPPP